MAAETVRYRRLPSGSAVPQFLRLKRSSIWAADDHLLSVEFRWFLEHYYRFRYRDIQVIAVRKTVSGQVSNVCCVLALALWALSTALGGAAGFAFGIVYGGMALIALVINITLGPTCDCRIVTAAQTRRLRGLQRLPKARQALAELEPLLRAAQPEPEPQLNTTVTPIDEPSAIAPGAPPP